MKFKILFLILLINNLVLFAHSGNTDSKGGHYNTKTGVYHFHKHDNNYFFLIIFLLLGLASFYFLYVISKNPPKTISNTNSKVSVLTPEQKQFHYELEKQRRKREAKEFRKSTGGCLMKIIAFIIYNLCCCIS